MCVRLRSRGVRVPPPPWVVWRAHLARSRRWALVGPFHVVRAPPRVLPRSLAPSSVLGRGGPLPVPPHLAWGCAPPAGWVCASGAFLCRGEGLVGGGGPCAATPVCAARGASGAGGRSASFRPSAFPGQATKRLSLASFWSWRAWPPYRTRSCSPAFSGRGSCGILACWRGFDCSPWFLWEPAAGGGGGRCSGPSDGRRGLAGGRGDHPLCLGGLRAGAPAACGLVGGWGGGSRRGPPAPRLGAACGSLPCPFSRRRRIPPRRARSIGVAGPPRAPGAACLAGGGGRRGGLWAAPPGAPSDRRPPSALPEWATLWVSRAMLWSRGARPPYCSGAPPRAAPGRGPRAAPARWCGLAHLPRPPREQAARGAGARGV